MSERDPLLSPRGLSRAQAAELIARLEAATEGCGELDLEIMKAVYPDYTFRIEPAVPALLMDARLMIGKDGHEDHVRVEPYTRSVDAALALVPEGWHFKLSSSPYTRKLCASLFGRDMPRVWVEATTLEIALCIAALKARGHEQE